MKAALIWSSVMIAAVLLIRSTLRAKLGSRLVYALWIPVVLRLMLPFALFTVTEVKETAAPEITAAAESVFNPAEEANERPSSDGAAPSANPILAVYLTGAGLTAGVFLLTNLSFARRLKRTRRRLDGERRLPVYVSGAADTPCLFGFFRPAVYLSENCADSNEVNLIFAHELAHFRHGDHIWSLVRCALVSLYWFDPLVWIAAVASRTDAELACDESVTERLSPKGRISYARTLLEFASGKKGYFSSAAGMGSGGGKLKERVKLIVKERKTAKITILLAVIAALTLTACAFTETKTVYAEAEPQIKEIADKTEEPQPLPAEEQETKQEGILDFVWPLGTTGRITQGFGNVKTADGETLHGGVDVGNLTKGEPVFASRSGTVTACGYDSTKGNFVTIDHGDGFETSYWHLDSVSVSEGQSVKRYETIGAAGDTGAATGANLHFEIIRNGKKVDPADYFAAQPSK